MNILMLHDIRSFDVNFFPDRYRQHSFLTDLEFINGLNLIKNNIVDINEIINENVLFNYAKSKNNYALTFDDGLKDHLWVAEILSSKKITAAFFIPFGVIEEKVFIHSHLIQFLNASGKRSLIANELNELLLYVYKLTPDQISNFKISKWKNNLWTQEEVFITRVLREYFNYESRELILLSLCQKYLSIDLSEIHEMFYLTLKEVLLIKEMGHIIGSHGYLSLDLRYENSSIINLELSKSFEYLKDYGSKNKLISYPNGGFSAELREAVIGAGYEIGFSTTHRSINIDDDILCIPRLDGTKLDIFK
jgi:peptidoglycan/xylan/chitin deacetylase (PgdA/CDA1 family)